MHTRISQMHLKELKDLICEISITPIDYRGPFTLYKEKERTTKYFFQADVKPSGNDSTSGSGERNLRQAYKTAEWKRSGWSMNTKCPACSYLSETYY